VATPSGAQVEEPIAWADVEAVVPDGQHGPSDEALVIRWCSMVQR
jgi:hypothetical protein